jgi:uncharacterized membrane protein
MREQLIDWLNLAWLVIRSNLLFMAWNSFLALVPLALSFWLFKPGRSPKSLSLWWWLGFLVFICFLPNAPYVLTDVIHLTRQMQLGDPLSIMILVLIPMFVIFMVVGVEAYVLSLINIGQYMQRHGWGKFIPKTELILHLLSAIGIYIGRVLRFNSWDLVTQPNNLINSISPDLIHKRPVLLILITFAVISLFYSLMKWLTLFLKRLVIHGD